MTNLIDQWVAYELAAWNGVAQDRGSLETELRAYATRGFSTFLFRIADGRVSYEHKHSPEWNWGSERDRNALHHRADLYRELLDTACVAFGLSGSGVLAIDLDDFGARRCKEPIFVFQKHRGANTILLPDVDLLMMHFFADRKYADPIAFEDKRDAAIFVGSTTGVRLDAGSVAGLRNARLRAGVFFRDEPNVTFDLPQIVQHDTPETEEMVRQLGIGGRLRTWQEQLDHKYLLSMDGNGATCSRVALSLRSNGVLVKYNSPYLLYYFHGLIPWAHYLPIIEDQDVLDLVRRAGSTLVRDRQVADRSRAFGEHYLSRIAVLRYTVGLIASYLVEFGDGGVFDPDALLIDCHAETGDGTPIWGAPGDWIGNDQPVVALTLDPAPQIDADDLVYRAAGRSGVLLGRCHGHQRCATLDGSPLHGIQIALRGETAARYALRSEARFIDGTIAETSDGDALTASAPLAAIRLHLSAR